VSKHFHIFHLYSNRIHRIFKAIFISVDVDTGTSKTGIKRGAAKKVQTFLCPHFEHKFYSTFLLHQNDKPEYKLGASHFEMEISL